MKKLAFTAYTILVGLLLLPWSACPQTETMKPHLVLREQEFHFGTIQEGKQIGHDFVILNQGDATLEIKKVSPG